MQETCWPEWLNWAITIGSAVIGVISGRVGYKWQNVLDVLADIFSILRPFADQIAQSRKAEIEARLAKKE